MMSREPFELTKRSLRNRSPDVESDELTNGPISGRRGEQMKNQEYVLGIVRRWLRIEFINTLLFYL